jgi:Holliday junction resolvase
VESKVQKKLIKELESKGYYVIKLSVTNKNGIPDIIAIPKDCTCEFYEVKRPGGIVSELQKFRAKELEEHGVKVFMHDGQSTRISDL